MNPLNNGENGNVFDNEEYRRRMLNQMDVPMYKKVHRIAPWLLKCDGKIVKYDTRGLNIWRVSNMGCIVF